MATAQHDAQNLNTLTRRGTTAVDNSEAGTYADCLLPSRECHWSRAAIALESHLTPIQFIFTYDISTYLYNYDRIYIYITRLPPPYITMAPLPPSLASTTLETHTDPSILHTVSSLIPRDLGPGQGKSVAMAVGLSLLGIVVAIFFFGWVRYIAAREHQREAERRKAKEASEKKAEEAAAETPAEDPPAE
ncbi:hypothetical protein TWF696_006943 [Orbilia brochopaga]|uniref:Uncharacterized protein n=1 Tax=Orbilia brochopaga TaxID=3140254 RepID=A0AAV9UWM6_9PEZI